MFVGRSIFSRHLRRGVQRPVRYVSTTDCARPPPALKIGDIIHGYRVEQVDHIKELNIKPFFLRHESTGAEHLHVHKDGDSNNVFSVSLRTTPTNDTGVAHVLEHITLAGSKLYDVRDPFFKMITRSLATYMNALTGPDFTSYPFSTQNEKDFENLLRMYIDGVFFPRLKPVDFRQEAWRLEHEKPDNKDTPLTIKGVVYNEMKGSLSSSSAIYNRGLLHHLLPDTTYSYESGGDPENIPELTHEEMKKFHQLHYHPSNAKFFTYGNFPLENHLKLINELVLSKFSENQLAKEQSIVKDQEFWTEPRTATIYCPFDPLSADPEKQTITSVAYLLPTLNTDYKEMFIIQILSSLLIDGPNAPFYKSLIESGLGSDYSPSTGLDGDTKQPYFTVGLQNVDPKDVEKIHEMIERTFRETAETGFTQERVDAILHDIELGLKHVSGNFGLRLATNLKSSWNHDGDAIEYLKVNKYVELFKEALSKDDRFWANLIEKYFLNNKHKLIFNMHPDPSYNDKKKQREQEIIDDKVSKLSDIDRQMILYEGIELMKIQSAKGDLSVLPNLEPSKDISRDLPCKTELKFDQHKGVNIQICEQPTNEVVYFKASLDIEKTIIDSDWVDYLPLFCEVATKLGAGNYNRHDFSQKIQLRTGGLGVSLLLNPSLDEFDKFKFQISIGSHCLKRNVRDMFELWENVFKQIHFQENKEYLMQLVKSAAAEMAEGVVDEGHLYAAKKASSSLSSISSLDERLSGLSYVARIKDMASIESIDSITSKLASIAKMILDPFKMKCALNAEPEAIQETLDELRKFIDTVQKNHANRAGGEDCPFTTNESRENATKIDDLKLPFATHFVAKALVTVPRKHEDFAKLVIMSTLISSRFLHTEVREKEGAYGSGLRLSNSGMLTFWSYRDPNTTKTLEIFKKAADWVEDGSEITDKDIEESKLGTFQSVDKPVPPGKRGIGYFTLGETDEIRDAYRKKLLDVTRDDVKAVAAKYLGQEKFETYII